MSSDVPIPKEAAATKQKKSTKSTEGSSLKKILSTGGSSFAGLLLIVLVSAAVVSFSIIAFELGEIKGLLGLKETTKKQISENQLEITELETSISKLQSEKKSAIEETNAAKKEVAFHEQNRDRWRKNVKWAQDQEKESERIKNQNLNQIKLLEVKISELNKEVSELDKDEASLIMQKTELNEAVKKLKSEKKEYSEFSILLNNLLRDFEETKKELVDTNRTKIKN